GTPPQLCPAHTDVFSFGGPHECHFINGTEKVRYVERHFYNREELARFDSDVGRYVGLSPYGEKQAQYWNSNPELMERQRTAVDWYCRHNYEGFIPFFVERRFPPSPSQYTPVHPSP
ncbi:HB2J protein, partial [Catharus fuscescens]|nr:HB2J protein [Catharus fuscescens]